MAVSQDRLQHADKPLWTERCGQVICCNGFHIYYYYYYYLLLVAKIYDLFYIFIFS